MEANNRPLALNAWEGGPNSYSVAIAAVNEQFDPEKDVQLKEHPYLTNFMVNALYDRIASQSQANYEQYLHIQPKLKDAHYDYVHGNESPSDLTLFLYTTAGLDSIETGRRTTRTWNMYDEVDKPILTDLDEHPLLYTTDTMSQPIYRIKNLNLNNRSDNLYVQVDRKQVVRQHFGGRVLTIVRNSLVLHNEDGSMPADVRTHIAKQREKALDVSLREEGHDYDYDQHSDVLQDYLEEHVANRRYDDDLTWASSILISYYAARRGVIKTKRLTEFGDQA